MAASEFYMPGYLIAPKWQADAPKWGELFSVDAAEILGVISKELTRLIGYSRVAQTTLLHAKTKSLPWKWRCAVEPMTLILRFSLAAYLVGLAIPLMLGFLAHSLVKYKRA